PDCRNDGNKTSTPAGQAILHLGGNDAEIFAVDEPALRERLQFAAEDAWRDFLRPLHAPQQAGPDLAIAERTILEVPHDSQLIFAADHFLKCSDRAAACCCCFSVRHRRWHSGLTHLQCILKYDKN